MPKGCEPVYTMNVCSMCGCSAALFESACTCAHSTEPHENTQFIIQAQIQGLVEIISDLALLDDYGEEFDGIFYQYKNSNAMFRLPGPTPSSGYIVSVLLCPG